jgi:hypothetical protein
MHAPVMVLPPKLAHRSVHQLLPPHTPALALTLAVPAAVVAAPGRRSTLRMKVQTTVHRAQCYPLSDPAQAGSSLKVMASKAMSVV